MTSLLSNGNAAGGRRTILKQDPFFVGQLDLGIRAWTANLVASEHAAHGTHQSAWPHTREILIGNIRHRRPLAW